MKLGIIGLAGAGKTTFFNALTQKGVGKQPSKDPNLGIVTVPDSRLAFLEQLYSSKKLVPATIEFVDIAGANTKSLLSSIREVDALIHIVRCFAEENSCVADIEAINIELVFSDLDIVERRIIKTTKEVKANKALVKELDLLNKLKSVLEEGKLLKSITDQLPKEESNMIQGFNLLTLKPVIYVANISLENTANNSSCVQEITTIAKEENSLVLDICAQIEEEIANLPADERGLFLEDLGITQSGLSRLISESYRILGLISFLTAGEKEVRAWTIKEGTSAKEAAGKIHSDIERGFIRAETVDYEALKKARNYNEAKKQGIVRLEGKDYTVKDGDVINFRFNV
ncbi:MAG: redox-regulated ATPase YchF [Defluviitaleaceae bacterium]|nr:redox-regulated ATPase YchF [Defluviitaleaceae bacterium]